MRITVTSASTKAANAALTALAAAAATDVELHGLYRDPAKAPAELVSCKTFKAVAGSIADASSLDFRGSDAVLVILPPLLNAPDPLNHVRQMCESVRDAAEQSGSVKKIVLLSSYGAEFEEGVGELMTNNISEQVLSTARVQNVIIARCAYFMENWTTFDEGLRAKEPFFASPLTPLDYKLPMVSIQDIGSNLAKTLLDAPRLDSKPYIFDLHGPAHYSPLDVQQAFSTVIGTNVAIRPIEKEKLVEFFAPFFSPEIAELYANMTKSILPGGIASVDSKLRDTTRHVVRGETTLHTALKVALK